MLKQLLKYIAKIINILEAVLKLKGIILKPLLKYIIQIIRNLEETGPKHLNVGMVKETKTADNQVWVSDLS